MSGRSEPYIVYYLQGRLLYSLLFLRSSSIQSITLLCQRTFEHNSPEKERCMLRRVVITGLGVLAPNGKGKEEFWNATTAGLSGVRRISRFDASRLPTQIAGEISDFDPEAFGLTPAEYTHLGRGTQLALAAANLALHDARLSNMLSEEERDATGVYMGSAMTSVEEAEHLWVQFTDGGAHSPRLTNKSEFVSAAPLMTHAPAAAIAVHHSLHGPCTSFTTACSAGADAIGQ